jgi:hypothetical protein
MPYAPSDGARIHDQAEGDGPPLVLHSGSRRPWRPVEVDEGAAGPRAALVDGPGEQALPGPGLPLQQDRADPPAGAETRQHALDVGQERANRHAPPEQLPAPDGAHRGTLVILGEEVPE